MANPQLENGHTRIANELLEALARIHLSQYESQIIFFILRKTYGFQKKMDRLTTSQIVEGTGILKSNVTRTVKQLTNRRITIKVGQLIGIQKDYELWLPRLSLQITSISKVIPTDNYNDTEPLSEQITKEASQEITGVSQEITKVISPLVTQKKKETIQKKPYKRNNDINRPKRRVYAPPDPDKYIKGRYGHLVRRT